MQHTVRISITIALGWLVIAPLGAQTASDNIQMVLMYVRGSHPDSCRLDVYVAVPYALLQFVSDAQSSFAQYQLAITIHDSTSLRKVGEQALDRTLRTTDRNAAQGTSDVADITQSIFHLAPGNYRIDVVMRDQLSNRTRQVVERCSLPDYRGQQVGMSGILLLSRIEERNRRYVITPYIGQELSALRDGFFAFFELYAAPGRQLQVRARLLDSTTTIFATAWQPIGTDSSGTAQHFFRIVPPIMRMPQGQYTLRIEAAADTGRILAHSSYQLQLRSGVSSSVFTDITKAIRQLRYIASQAEIDSMLAKPTDAERRAAFEQFWRDHDPTPGTLRNEAFEEYYARVEYANRHFRSYAEGWLTDMGMVYIVLGEPSSVERRVNPYDNRSIVIWTYAQLNRRYIFIDNTGFGDYRLSPSTPFFLSEKYRYRGVQ